MLARAAASDLAVLCADRSTRRAGGGDASAVKDDSLSGPLGGNGGVRAGRHDGAAVRRFWHTLVSRGERVGGTGGRVDFERSHDGLSNGGLNFEKGENGDEK